MDKPILFFAESCPDTAPFVAELKRLNVDYERVEVLTSLANFKQFLRLRDKSAVFDNAKSNGYVGIPALLLNSGEVILDYKQLADVFTP
ncbi:hypothetical protein P9074_10415 [Gallibacterium anatis]|uniref:hypothetical protein n=1 Tax=Gallibacterium anatis TaxID=750 RepID=UPI0005321543|nr:hypothetical protein [Gallibacterium anatis]KGQ24709.1 hypothetical protein JP33_08410 [Gallibacterium anatis CCM5995]KGQ50858.1 hypothetical protein JL04_03000 [Gallibacterium anatis]